MNNDILTVSELNHEVAELLEQSFAWVWVEGEISNLSRPASGHIYFSLKDSAARVRCAMFRSRLRDAGFEPENGMQVQVRAKVGLYQPWGEFQLVVDRLQEAGAGALQRQFEQLKQKLAAEGLFDEDAKREVPGHARGIAVITSRSGAAVRDVISVIRRRFPATPVHLYPVSVQGKTSAAEICHALALADADTDCDVILLVRGGGSIEDLWSFNEETVARAIHACRTPLVCGVGHEIDFTIADFVADLRAATPTAAAEAVTPDQQAWFQTLDWYAGRLQQLLEERLKQDEQRLAWLGRRLQQQHPLAHLGRMRQQLQALTGNLRLRLATRLQLERSRLAQARGRLLAVSPARELELRQQRLHHNHGRIIRAMTSSLGQADARLSRQAAMLNALSPLQTLARGYSITTDAAGHALTSSAKLEPGQRIITRLHQGEVDSEITSVSPPDID